MRLITIAILACSGISYIPSVVAQEPATEKSYVLEEIIVTARKREESLQEIPESIVGMSSFAILSSKLDIINDAVPLVMEGNK
ncbi:MAG: hypothetical protein IIA75_04360 [Proteobacteria bacterium]|nr:hypothetical protein [Pseudomonadota bacterium]